MPPFPKRKSLKLNNNSMNTNQSQHNNVNTRPFNNNISHTQHIQIVKKQNKYEYPLDIILKKPLIAELTIYGYIRKYKPFYLKEIIKIIYNFYFIKILNYKIKGIGSNEFGQQGIGNYENIKT
eukprot:415002_1